MGEIRIAERCGFDGLDTKFQEVPFQIGVCGVPLLRWAQVSIECELWDTWSVGDHVVYVGRVAGAEASTVDHPLVHYDRTFLGLGLGPVGPRDGPLGAERPP